MNQVRTQNAAVEWLERCAHRTKSRPHRITPSEVAMAIGSYAPTVGKVAKQIILELRLRNLDVRYILVLNKRYFEFR